MPTSRGEIARRVLSVLTKTANYPGFYDEVGVNDAIQEAIDYVNVEMFIGVEGWNVKLHTFENVPPNTITLPVLPSMAMIQEVRVQYGNLLVPLTYDDGNRQTMYMENSGIQQWGSTYRIIDNAFYFNPALVGGQSGDSFSGIIQVEYQGYSKRLQSDEDYIESHFDHAMLNFIKYRAATILAARVEKETVSWGGLEKSWFDQMQKMVTKRNSQTVQVREFGDS